jgi:NAD(P)H-dependent FMN reductase
MNTIGFSAGVVGHESNVDRMVKAIMDATDHETEFVKLTELDFSACKGCVWLCAEPEVCRLDDALLPHIQKVKEADAVVLGSPVHFNTISATMVAFISRFWGFRHVNFSLKDKPFVLAVSAGEKLRKAPDDFRKALEPFRVNVLHSVQFRSGIPPCFKCGRHHECRIGGAYHWLGPKARDLKIVPELFNKWENCSETVTQIEEAGAKLKHAVSSLA